MDEKIIAAILLFLSASVLFATAVFLFVKNRGGILKKQKEEKDGTEKKSVDRTEMEEKGMLPKDFSIALEVAYENTGSILDMLGQLESRYKEDTITEERIKSAREYLLHSRYKDYETALYQCLGYDNKEELKNLYAGIIVKDIGRRKCLPMKE